MKTPMIFAFGAWLDEKRIELRLPPVLLDDLEASGESLCLSQSASEVVEKEYINGSRQCRLSVDITAQGSVEKRRDLIEWLTSLVYVLNNLNNYDIDSTHRILRCSCTAPSIRMRTENGMLKYAISVSIVYKES